jgi:hypothetical protein
MIFSGHNSKKSVMKMKEMIKCVLKKNAPRSNLSVRVPRQNATTTVFAVNVLMLIAEREALFIV